MLFSRGAFTKTCIRPFGLHGSKLAANIGTSLATRASLFPPVAHFSDKATPQNPPASPPVPLGVAAVVQAHTSAAHNTHPPRPKIFDEFALTHRVAVVSGGNGSLGLEMALALCEAGAQAVYCVDIPARPSHEWECTREHVRRMGTGGRLEYVSVDVRDQKGVWEAVEEIGDRERRLDVCVAAAGIVKSPVGCLEYPAAQIKEVKASSPRAGDVDRLLQVLDVNTNGVLFTAQAAGRQMVRFGLPGSIILVASIAGTVTLKVDDPSLDGRWL
jgi:NADP-dependent 3-hydroxy acid dehydrogenase YdfG